MWNKVFIVHLNNIFWLSQLLYNQFRYQLYSYEVSTQYFWEKYCSAQIILPDSEF
jgi:hypothetical protein